MLLLPLVLGVALFFVARAVTSSLIEDYAERTAQHFQAQASALLREVEVVAKLLLRDSEFIADAAAPAPSLIDPMALCEIIDSYKSGVDSISAVYLVSEAQGYIYTDQGYFLDGSLQGVLDRIGMTAAEFESRARSGEYDGWHVANEGYFAPYYMETVLPPGGSEPVGTLIITLSTNRLLEVLYSSDAELSCIFNETCSISSIIGGYVAPNWHSEREVSQLLDTPVKCFYITEADFTYLVAVSTSEYYTPLRLLILGFSLYFLVVLGSGFAYLFRVSRRRYQAVASLLEGVPQRPDGNPSEEEIYASIRKSLREYRDKRENERELQQADNLRVLLFGLAGKEITAQQLRGAGLPVPCPGYYVATFVVRDYPEMAAAQDEESGRDDVMQVILRSCLHDLAAEKFAVSCTHNLQDFTAVFAQTAAESSAEDLREVIRGAVDLIERNYGLSICVTISQRITDPARVGDAFRETAKLHNFAKSVDSEAKLLFQEDLGSDMGDLLSGNYLKQVQILTNTLLVGEYEHVPQMVSAVLEENIANLRKDYKLAQERLAGISNLLLEAVIASGLFEDDLERVEETFRQADSVSRLDAAVAATFRQMAERAGQEGNEDAVGRACRYIQENSRNADLSVPDICRATGVSVQHLSRLFRKKLDTTITEYLHLCRINLAKQLLAETKLTVAAISEQAGYNNTETFTRNFRRLEGVTPSSFRSMIHRMASSS